MADAPQRCPSCGASLRDNAIPPQVRRQYTTQQFRRVRRLFTRALLDLEAPRVEGKTQWRCPECDHRWQGPGNHY